MMKAAEVSALIANILELDYITDDDNFFDLGGNSILALALISRIKEKSGVEISLLDFIYDPTAHGLAQRTERSGD